MNSTEILDRSSYTSTGFYTYKKIWPFFWRVLVICIGSFSFAYVFAYFSTIKCVDNEHKQRTYSFRVQYFFLQGIPSLFAIFGSIVNIYAYKIFSRRNCLCVAGIIQTIGTAIVLINMKNQQNIEEYMKQPQIWIGRAIQGISMGMYSILCPQIIKEIVPTQLSVNLGIFHQLFIALGTLVAKIIKISNNSIPFWIVVAIPIPLFLIQLFLLKTVFKYQTPYYWIQIQKQSKSRDFFNNLYYEDVAEQLFLDTKKAYQLQHEGQVLNRDFDMKSVMKKSLSIGVYIAVLQQLSGISYIIMYGVHPDRCDYFQNASHQAIFFQIGGTMVQCAATLTLILLNTACCPAVLKKTSKRRVLFQIGTVYSAIMATAAISMVYPFDTSLNYPLVDQILITIYMGFYGLSIGPITWLYFSEILECRQMSIAISFNWLARFIIVFCFPLLGNPQANNNQILFTNFMILSPLLWICVYANQKYLVETKNRTRLDIIRDLDAKVLPIACCN